MKKSELKALIREVIKETSGAGGITSTMKSLAGGVNHGKVHQSVNYAMQGRYTEAENAMRSIIADANDSVKKSVIESLKNIKPVKINGKIATTGELANSKPHVDWIDNQYIPWLEKTTGKKI